MSFTGLSNGYQQEQRQISRNSSESSSECTVTIPDGLRVKTEPQSPHDTDHETIPTDNNNNVDKPIIKLNKRILDTNDDEQSQSDKHRKTSRSRSPVSKINDRSIDMLQRIFPQQSRAVLELIMRSSENDVVKAIESLIPEGSHHVGNVNFPTMVNVRSVAAPYEAYSQLEERHKSAFSPITKNGVCLKKAEGPVSAFQPIRQQYNRPQVSPTSIYQDHFKYPAHYNRHASTALLSLSSAKHIHIQGEHRPTMHCSHCCFKINLGDKFCSECGKCLLTKEGLEKSWTT